MAKKYRRHLGNLWLIPEFQSKIVTTILASSILIIAAYVIFFFTYVRQQFQTLITYASVSPEVMASLQLEMSLVFQWLVALSFLILVIMIWVAMFLSHRAAGPMFRFKKVFEAIRAGDPSTRIHLRPKDDFQDVAQEFNWMMDELK